MEFSLDDPSIWDVLMRESTSFPNDNDIKKHLSRKGSISVVRLFQQLRNATSASEVDMLSSIIWGLLPPQIPEQFIQEFNEALRLGPKRVGGIQHQKQLFRSFYTAMDSLSQRIHAPQDARVYTQEYQFDLGGKLLQSLCR